MTAWKRDEDLADALDALAVALRTQHPADLTLPQATRLYRVLRELDVALELPWPEMTR